MAPWNDSASLLEDTNPGVALAAEGMSGSSWYCWPVLRFGRVLQPNSGNGLDVATAKEIGALFGQGQPAARRYLRDRLTGLGRLVEEAGGRLQREWPEHLRLGTKPLVELEKVWKPDEIVLTYSFVPIVRLPRFIIELGDCAWQIRESLTICGAPAMSKVWVTASLVAYQGEPTDRQPLRRADLDAVRQAFDVLSGKALDTLTQYYLRVLNEDSRCLPLEKPIHFDELATKAQTEIVSLASRVDLGDAFDFLEEKGLRRFRAEAEVAEVPGAREVLEFLEWSERPAAPDLDGWDLVRPKILAIYADQPACGSVRALVVPRVEPGEPQVARTWYGILTERLETEKQPTQFPLSESAGRFIAKEYGRYF